MQLVDWLCSWETGSAAALSTGSVAALSTGSVGSRLVLQMEDW